MHYSHCRFVFMRSSFDTAWVYENNQDLCRWLDSANTVFYDSDCPTVVYRLNFGCTDRIAYRMDSSYVA
jgi:hypothetical protein